MKIQRLITIMFIFISIIAFLGHMAECGIMTCFDTAKPAEDETAKPRGLLAEGLLATDAEIERIFTRGLLVDNPEDDVEEGLFVIIHKSEDRAAETAKPAETAETAELDELYDQIFSSEIRKDRRALTIRIYNKIKTIDEPAKLEEKAEGIRRELDELDEPAKLEERILEGDRNRMLKSGAKRINLTLFKKTTERKFNEIAEKRQRLQERTELIDLRKRILKKIEERIQTLKEKTQTLEEKTLEEKTLEEKTQK